MSASKECCLSDDYVVMTIDIDGSPLVEFPLGELFDSATSTLTDEYLKVLQDYAAQLVEDTTWLDKKLKSRLLCSRFGVFHRRDEGVIISLRKPALQRRITQTLRSHSGSHHPIEIPIFIRFLRPKVDLPPRRTKFPVTANCVYGIHNPSSHSSSTTSSATFWSVVVDKGEQQGLDENAPASNSVFCSASPVLVETAGGASVIRNRHELHYNVLVATPRDGTATLAQLNLADSIGDPSFCDSGDTDLLDGCGIKMGDTAVVSIDKKHTKYDDFHCSSPGAYISLSISPSNEQDVVGGNPNDITSLCMGNDSPGLLASNSSAFVVHQLMVPVYDCIAAMTAYHDFPFHGSDCTEMHRLPHPRLLTRYQPIDRGRSHVRPL